MEASHDLEATGQVRPDSGGSDPELGLRAEALNPDTKPLLDPSGGGSPQLPSSPPTFELWGGWLIPAAPYPASEDEEMKRPATTWNAPGRAPEAQAADLRRQGMRRRLLQMTRAYARRLR
jgi:hypothetical protein